jgi:ABC-2 type transport system permease protein
MMVALPVVQLLLFGYAINTDVRTCRPWCSTRTGTATGSRDLVRRHGGHRLLRHGGPRRATPRIERACASGRIKVGGWWCRPITAAPSRSGAEAGAAGGRRQRPHDGRSATRPRQASCRHSPARDVEQPSRARRRPPQLLSVAVATWYNPELRTAVNVVPGLIGMILTMTMVMLTAMAIARERERGTLEALIVSPVSRRRARGRQDRCPTSRSATCR